MNNKYNNLLATFEPIRALVFDVDGVFTDSRLLVTEAGELLRQMNARDGFALKCALEAGLQVAIITGGTSQGVVRRFEVLGVQHIWSGVRHKAPVLQQFLTQQGISPQHTLYMGDDLPDLPPLQMVGLPTCPADAAPEVLATAAYVSPYAGGAGCVRDVIEKVLKLQHRWNVVG